MRKYLWFGVLFVLASVVVTRYHEEHTENPAAIDRNGIQATVSPDDAPHTQANGTDSQRDSPGWHVAYLILGWPNGVTVWALFLTMIVIAEQTHETRKAAEAALLSAQATVHAERSWLLIDTLTLHDDGTISYKVRNFGSTPATILKARAHSDLTLMAREPPEAASFSGLELDPEEMMEGIVPPAKEWTGVVNPVSEAGLERVMEVSIFLWVFGIVIYQDVFGRHETRFCYRYVVEDTTRGWSMTFAPCGEPRYNRAD